MRHFPILLALLAGCAPYDPYLDEGAWRPSGTNDENLRAMVSRPADLVRGTGDPGSEGSLAAAAVGRLRANQVTPLPDTAIVRLGGGSSP